MVSQGPFDKKDVQHLEDLVSSLLPLIININQYDSYDGTP